LTDGVQVQRLNKFKKGRKRGVGEGGGRGNQGKLEAARKNKRTLSIEAIRRKQKKTLKRGKVEVHLDSWDLKRLGRERGTGLKKKKPTVEAAGRLKGNLDDKEKREQRVLG